MSHEPGSLRARLRTSADQAWSLYCALEVEIPHRPAVSTNGDSGRQKRTVAPIPWNSVAAELTLEFHNEIRRFETHLKERIIGGYPRRRGSSSSNTRKALESVVNLCETCDDGTALGVLNYTDGWIRRADTTFNPQNGLHRLPREPGHREAPCPYCQRSTMRWNPTRGFIVCVNPTCRNTDGHRPRWTAEFTVGEYHMTFHWDEVQEAA